jgi:hypothetical protein
LLAFKRIGILNEADILELLTQVFDEFLCCVTSSGPHPPGTMVVYTHRPNFNLIRHGGLRETTGALTSLGEIVRVGYLKLYEDIAALVTQQLFEVVRLDRNRFNYVFHSLRDNCVVLRHLADPDPERIF